MANTDLIILGTIYFIPSHGYQLKKYIKESFGNPYFKLNNNVLYPTLARMEKEDLIEGKEMPGEKMNKKVYHITEKGKKRLFELVATPVKPDIDDFDFKVQAVFFDLIPKESRLKVIKPLYETKLQLYQESLKKKEIYGPNIPPISLIILEYGIKETENSLEFYKKLMDAK
jgi:DNA-binding PadR family transcriptional regulator